MSKPLGQVMMAPVGYNGNGNWSGPWAAPYGNPFVSTADAFGVPEQKGPYGFDLRRYRYSCSDGSQRDMTPQEAQALADAGISCEPVAAGTLALMGRRAGMGQAAPSPNKTRVNSVAVLAAGAVAGLALSYFSKKQKVTMPLTAGALTGGVTALLGYHMAGWLK